MAHIILFDNEVRDHLLPLTFTRPVCELRVGALTIREKWEHWLNAKSSFITQDYLAEKYPIDNDSVNYLINGSVLPSDRLCYLIERMDMNEAYLNGEELIVAKMSEEQLEKLMQDEDFDELKGYDLQDTPYLKINWLWDLVNHNAQAIEEDFELLTQGRTSQAISPSNQVVGDTGQIFLEPGASVEACTLNTTEGSIYIGKDAVVMEGSHLRGPVALGAHAQVKMGAKIYGGTTIGPWCKAGGEVSQSVMLGYSNKAHDGFLGHAYLGEWVNLGADTNNSNLKNNYRPIKAWSYVEESFVDTGQQFFGSVFGDHAKTGINTMLNTGTIVGVAANVFGPGFPRNFIPSFSWGGAHGFKTFKTESVFEMAQTMMARRNVPFHVTERLILLRIYESTAKYRRWEQTEKA